LLAHPEIASKQSIVRQYDHEVQGGSVIKPFMGVGHDAPTDGCVFRPKLGSWRAVVLSNGMNPEIGKFDPYVMAKTAVDEAYRNMIAVGGGLLHAAILDNFCWGDAKSPQELAGLVRAAEGCREGAAAYQLPFISGKDSFNNTWKSDDGTLHSIPPTLLISAIGVLNDARECLSSSFKKEGNLVYLIGDTKPDLKGSLAYRLWGETAGTLADVDFAQAKNLYKKLMSVMKHRLVLSCHDLSEGGLGVAAAEMAFGSNLGVEITVTGSWTTDPSTYLFSETPSRLLVEVAPEAKASFEQMMGLLSVALIGKTTKKSDFIVKNNDAVLFSEPVEKLKSLWQGTLAHL
jgi:phosphoribosylformylglycinamidine synthase